MTAVVLFAAGVALASPPGLSPGPADARTRYRESFPYLRASAEHWDIRIERTQDGRYPLTLTWAMGGQSAHGFARIPEDQAYPERFQADVVVEGHTRVLSVLAEEATCIAADDTPHALRVTVRIDGIKGFEEPACGEFVLPDPP